MYELTCNITQCFKYVCKCVVCEIAADFTMSTSNNFFCVIVFYHSFMIYGFQTHHTVIHVRIWSVVLYTYHVNRYTVHHPRIQDTNCLVRNTTCGKPYSGRSGEPCDRRQLHSFWGWVVGTSYFRKVKCTPSTASAPEKETHCAVYDVTDLEYMDWNLLQPELWPVSQKPTLRHYKKIDGATLRTEPTFSTLGPHKRLFYERFGNGMQGSAIQSRLVRIGKFGISCLIFFFLALTTKNMDQI